MVVCFYAETNFLLSIAMGQDPRAKELLAATFLSFRLVIPSVCCMEALSVLASKKSERHEFKEQLDQQIRQVRRDVTSSHAKQLLHLLGQSRLENEELQNEVRERLFWALEQLSKVGVLCPLSPAALQASLSNPILNDPTDNLILHTILSHAGTNSDDQKAFLSGDGDFKVPEAREALRNAGIEKYFTTAQDFLGWLQSLS